MTTTKTYTETITKFAVTEVAPAMEDYRSGRGIESTVDAQVRASEIAREFGKDEKEVWKEAVAIAKNDNTFTETITEFATTELVAAMNEYHSGFGVEGTVDAQCHSNQIARDFGKDEKEVWKEAVAIAKTYEKEEWKKVSL